jgi:hypothetical protein
LIVVALSTGCVHLRLSDGPGDVDLARPPPAIAARGATLPRPPRDPALVVSPGVMAGVAARHTDRAFSSDAGLGFELGIYATRVNLSDTVLEGKAPDYGFGPDAQAWGINLGFTPSATRSPQQKTHQPSAYVEAQWRCDLAGVAAGAAFTPWDSRRALTAVQVTPMYGPLYARVQVLLDGNLACELGVALKIPIVVSWGR